MGKTCHCRRNVFRISLIGPGRATSFEISKPFVALVGRSRCPVVIGKSGGDLGEEPVDYPDEDRELDCFRSETSGAGSRCSATVSRGGDSCGVCAQAASPVVFNVPKPSRHGSLRVPCRVAQVRSACAGTSHGTYAPIRESIGWIAPGGQLGDVQNSPISVPGVRFSIVLLPSSLSRTLQTSSRFGATFTSST